MPQEDIEKLDDQPAATRDRLVGMARNLYSIWKRDDKFGRFSEFMADQSRIVQDSNIPAAQKKQLQEDYLKITVIMAR